MRSRWLRALPMVLLVGCEATPPPAGDAGAPSPFAEVPFAPTRAEDFAVDPAVGFPLSRRHLLVAFREGATEAAAAQAVRSVDGTVVGALGEARIAQVALPAGTSTADRLARVERLAADPAVRAVSEDMPLAPSLVPPWRSGNTAWSWRAPGVSVGNWSLRAMGMPVAWNLKPMIDPVAESRRVEVGVIDSGFQRHGDLVSDVLQVLNPFRGDDPADIYAFHGTAVAGIIGARWNGLGSDGISPFVHLLGIESTSALDPSVPYSVGAAIAAAWSLLRRHASTRPRLVNVSLAMNHYSGCYARPGGALRRCDPRQGTTTWGPAVPDSDCDGALTRQRLTAAGAVFSQAVDAAQRGGEVLFVVAAANDSGPSDPGDPCAPGAAGMRGMGLFPARFASAMTAAGLIQENPHVLVVEVVRRNEDMRGALQRAPYSNVGGHILAPGDGISSPRGGGPRSTVADMSGTSAATPHVTGAAAWLLALNPRLSDVALRALLLAQQGEAVDGTPTRARLFVPAAVARMDVSVPGVSGRTVNGARLLADMDDGTPDGFTRLDRDMFGVVVGPHTARRSPAQLAGEVDMADLRMLRDSALFFEGETDARCPEETPACDLNADGEALRDPATELNPRALITHQPPGGAGPGADENLRALAAHFDGDPVQGWRADELPTLLRSADFEVYPTEFLGRAGATAVEITLGGEAPEARYRAPRREPLTAIRVTSPTVLTSPHTVSPTVSVRVVGGPHDGRTLTSGLPLAVGPGLSATLFLNACALEPGATIDVLAPRTASCDPDAGVGDGGLSDASLVDVPIADAGARDAGGGVDAGANCAALAAGTAPYMEFLLAGGPLPTSYSVCYGLVPPSTFRCYLFDGQTFCRANGRVPLSGDLEYVNVDFAFQGSAPTAEPWRTDIAPDRVRIGFLRGTLGVDARTTRDFGLSETASMSGRTTITRYGAVGAMIEGTFSGQGQVSQILPAVASYEPVTLTGRFRIPRTMDQ